MRNPLPALTLVVWSVFAVGCSDPATTTATTTSPPATTAPVTTLPATTQPPATLPATTTPTTMPTTTVPDDAAAVPVLAYVVRDERVVPVRRTVPADAGALGGALQATLVGPTAAEQADGATTALPAGVGLRSVYVNERIAWIDLDRGVEAGGGSASMFLRLAQLTATALATGSVDGVQFRLDGEWISTFSGEGIVLDHPWSLADIDGQLPIIAPERPAPGDRVASPIRVTGTANTFEATFQVQVLDDTGGLITEATVMATSGTGTRGRFDVTLPVGDHEGAATVRLLEYSPKDGSPTAVIDVPVTVVG